MTTRRDHSTARELLERIARKIVDYAAVRNKAGIVRMRYLARQIVDILPIMRPLRLKDGRRAELEPDDSKLPKRRH